MHPPTPLLFLNKSPIIDMQKVKKSLGLILKKYGFSSYKNRWFYTSSSVQIILEFEKSKGVDVYSLRIGFWFLDLASQPEIVPHAYECHIVSDLRYLVKNAEVLENQFIYIEHNSDYSIQTETRIDIVNKVGNPIIENLLARYSTMDELRKRYAEHRFKFALVKAEVRNYFGDKEWVAYVRSPSEKITIIVPE